MADRIQLSLPGLAPPTPQPTLTEEEERAKLCSTCAMFWPTCNWLVLRLNTGACDGWMPRCTTTEVVNGGVRCTS